jgi:hypothetical protein
MACYIVVIASCLVVVALHLTRNNSKLAMGLELWPARLRGRGCVHVREIGGLGGLGTMQGPDARDGVCDHFS